MVLLKSLRMTAERNVESSLALAPLSSGFSAEEVRLLAARFVRRRYSQGELLLSEGDPCRGLYIIDSGRLRTLKC